MENKKHTPVQTKRRTIMIGAVLSFILVLLGAATLVLIQKPIQESQDLRQQASVDDGVVTTSFSPTTGSTSQVNQPLEIDFMADSGGVQISGVTFVFNVVTDTLAAPPEFIVSDTSRFTVMHSEFSATTDGYLASITIIGNPPLQPVTLSGPTALGTLQLNPSSAGSIEINFDVENSISAVFNASPPVDELTHIATLHYTITDPSGTPVPSATASVAPTATATISPSPTATTDPGTGTGGPVSCNQSCSSNDQCQAGHRCYNGACRLATNVSSTTCSNTQTNTNTYSQSQNQNQGANNGCNEYCADNSECSSGYNCYYNRCRNPLNLDNTSCSQPTQQVVTAMAASCNQGCSSHADCAVNLLCYSPTGTCRLAVNPGSGSCSPVQYQTVSQIYNTPTGTSTTTQTKGSSGSPDSGSTTTGTTTNQTTSPTASAIATASPGSGSSTPRPTATTSDSSLPLKDETAVDRAWEYLQTQLEERGISLPMFFIILGLGLLLIIIVLSLLARAMTRGASSPPRIVPIAGRRPNDEKANQYEQQLASKINTLQQQPSATSSSAPRPGVPPQSSMTERLQQRGVQPPGSGQPPQPPQPKV